MKFKRFTKPTFLKEIGRGLLGCFLARFGQEFAEKGVTLPAAELPEDQFFDAAAKLAMSPDGLPDTFIEAAFAIEGMANDEGQERLLRALEKSDPPMDFHEDSSHADIAVQVFLANPAVFAKKHNEQRLSRLSTFEYFGNKKPVDRRDAFAMPDAATIERLTKDFDDWFPLHNRGKQTTHIDPYYIEGEYWFVIRHGDTFARMPTAVENREVRILHFRPAKDDVVVYSPERDEIRIHAGTKGERELYRQTFGIRLFGDAEHFSERKAYTLEPLRTDGAACLDTDGITGLSQIVLREVEWAWDNGHNEVQIKRADDLFAATAARGADAYLVPNGARLIRASFDFYFGDSLKPRRVQVRLPNTVKVGRHCDAQIVQQWISARGFRAALKPTNGGDSNVETLAVS